MRWNRSLQTVDVHCEGEIGRVVTGGFLDIPGQSMAAKLHYINHRDDSLRRLLCSEPRGGPAGSFVLLTPPSQPEADVGLIVLQPDQAHAMSGSNAICAVTAILETGMRPIVEPRTRLTLDTAAGLVKAEASCSDGRVTRVTVDMPPAFVVTRNALLNTKKWGQIRYDLCFGGVFYVLVDVEQLALPIIPDNARALAMAGVELREMIASSTSVEHPEIPEINGIAYLVFRSEEPDGAIRTCTTLPPGRVDRSPCGTGSNANMAVFHEQGQVNLGDSLVSRSIIGGEFTTTVKQEITVGSYPAIRNTVSGRAWIYAVSQIGLDPTDPFPQGFILSDTWGSS